MSLSINVRPHGTMAVADIRPNGRPTAHPGLGFTWLKFPLLLNFPHREHPPVHLTQFLAEISTTGPEQPLMSLGQAQPQASLGFSSNVRLQPQPFELWLRLSGEQLEALERRRKGKRTEFHVNLSVQIHCAGAIHCVREDARYPVNESDWAEILRQVGYVDRLIVAVDLPLAAPEPISAAVEHLRAAHEHLMGGRYTEAVGACRKAVESLRPAVDDPKAKVIRTTFAGPEEARRNMSPGERIELVRLAVQHFTHPAHHAESGKPREIYSREEALFVLSAAAGVIWEALGRRNTAPAKPDVSQETSTP